MHTSRALRAFIKSLLISAAFGVSGVSGVANAQTTITVTHPETPPPTIIDLGAPGASVGDQRLWHFNAVTSDGVAVRTDWIMTTTAINAPEKGYDSRITTGIFTFGNGTDNQILLQGVALYPGKDATLKFSAKTLRAVVGGTGQYAGARGWVESLHRPDGTWTHVFYLK